MVLWLLKSPIASNGLASWVRVSILGHWKGGWGWFVDRAYGQFGGFHFEGLLALLREVFTVDNDGLVSGKDCAPVYAASMVDDKMHSWDAGGLRVSVGLL